MKLALAKQNVPELIRVIKMPGIVFATGYCKTLQNKSVPESLPSTSVLGFMELTIILPNDITTCMHAPIYHKFHMINYG